MKKIRVKFRKSHGKKWATPIIIASCNNPKDSHRGMEVAIVEKGYDIYQIPKNRVMTYQFAFNTKSKGWVGEGSSGSRKWGSEGLKRYWKRLTGQDLPDNINDVGKSTHEEDI